MASIAGNCQDQVHLVHRQNGIVRVWWGSDEKHFGPTSAVEMIRRREVNTQRVWATNRSWRQEFSTPAKM